MIQSEFAEVTNDRAVLVGVDWPGQQGALNSEDSLEELSKLAGTAGIQVLGQAVQRLPRPDPATFIRSGKVQEVKDWIAVLAANMVVFDEELSPRHQRELERVFGEEVRVLDRSALILDIFAQHARSREGALQVALAQYEYRLPRLTRQWTHLARQAGGGAARGGSGGVGLRGPGETQLETDRREIQRRITHLKAQLEEVRAHRERHRSQRKKQGIPVVGLVGYTNAGKSTLLNRLSGAEIYVADQLFATLDPTTRRVRLPSGLDVLITDTVGFIQKLPASVIAAFRATLEEVAEADVLLHVVDASHPNAREHIRVVEHTLYDELGVGSKPIALVLNKIDQGQGPAEAVFEDILADYPHALRISARKGIGIDALLEEVDRLLKSRFVLMVVEIPYARGDVISHFHELAEVTEEHAFEATIQLHGKLDRRNVDVFSQFQVGSAVNFV